MIERIDDIIARNAAEAEAARAYLESFTLAEGLVNYAPAYRAIGNVAATGIVDQASPTSIAESGAELARALYAMPESRVDGDDNDPDGVMYWINNYG